MIPRGRFGSAYARRETARAEVLTGEVLTPPLPKFGRRALEHFFKKSLKRLIFVS